MLVIDANLDESGIHDGAEICVIGGYWSVRSRWRHLDTYWREVLARFNVPLNRFHAKDLFPRGAGFFRKWAKADCDSLLRALADTIVNSQISPITSGIVVKDFYSFSQNQRRFMTGATIKKGKRVTTGCPDKPYFVVFQHCIRRIGCYAPVGGKAHFSFGLDRPFGGYAASLLEEIKKNPFQINCKERLGDPSFPRAKETPSLQAADLLVHLTYQHMLERHAADDWNVLPSGLLGMCIVNAKERDDFALLNKPCLQAGLNQSYERSGRWDRPRRRGQR
jgi:hypothetical protein